ncbi:MAG TPA: SpoIIE family protein phosphatase [Vicinamibacterales bacterium]|nr:SpoIIE family protein phosphatase [Vicinamibacterales bacterium]
MVDTTEVFIDRLGPPAETQLVRQIRDAVLGGRLAPGDALPSVRQLSRELGLDGLVVADAYRTLAHDAVLRRGRGGPVIDPDSVATLHRLSARSLTRKVQAALTTPIHLATGRLEVLGDSMPLVDAGGDLIDVVDQSDTVHMFLGDVVGHGAGAALAMAMIRASIRTSLRWAPDLTRVLEDVNEMLRVTTADRVYATAAALRVDQAGHLQYVLAGHHHIAHWHAGSSRVCRLDRHQPALGLVGGTGWVAHRVVLGPGDLLAVYTDGLHETSDRRGALLGHEAIEHQLGEVARRPLGEVRQAVLDLVERHGPQLDDRALLLARLS